MKRHRSELAVIESLGWVESIDPLSLCQVEGHGAYACQHLMSRLPFEVDD